MKARRLTPIHRDHLRYFGYPKQAATLFAAEHNAKVVLRLSRPPASMAVPRPKKNGRAMPKVSKKELKTLSASTNGEELRRGLSALSPKQRRKLVELHLSHIEAAGLVPAASGASAETVITLAQFAPPGVQHAGMVNWDAPQSGAGRVPPGLDDAGRALHALIANRAASTGSHYFAAMAAVTGQPGYAALSDIPPTPVQQGLDPQREAQDGAARALAVSAGFGWLDAWEYFEYLQGLSALQGDDGSADVPWLDSRPLSTPPRPWSDSENDPDTGVAAAPDSDWERDKRRAASAGLGDMEFSKGLWRAGAENGRDLVGELADAKRAQAIANHQARYDGFLDQARARQDNIRWSAINGELQRRARQRVAAPGRGGLPRGVRARGSTDPDQLRADLQRIADGQVNGRAA